MTQVGPSLVCGTTLLKAVPKGTLLVHVRTRTTTVCDAPELCLSSDTDTNEVVMVEHYALPPSYTLNDRWEQPMRRRDFGDLVNDALECVTTGLGRSNTMLVRTNNGEFYEAAARDLAAGTELKRYARVLEHLMPLLNRYPINRALYVETVLQRVLPLELQIIGSLMPVFGPVGWKRTLPPVIVCHDDVLLCPYENRVRATPDQCRDYLTRVCDDPVLNLSDLDAQDRLRWFLSREDDSSEGDLDDQEEDSEDY